MRILQVHTRYREAGGEDRVVTNEAETLRDAGHDVVQVHAANPESRSRAAASLAVAPWNPRAAARLRDEAVRTAPDVAHLHNTWFALSPAVIPALRGAGVPVVVTLHNYRVACVASTLLRDGAPCEDCVGRSPLPGVRHRCYRGSAAQSAVAALTIATARARRVWDSVAVFIAFSDFARGRFAAAGLPEDRIVVKPHATADPGPRSLPPSRSSTVLFVGRLSPEKGLDVLLDGWRAAAPEHLQLEVIGDGPERAALEARRVPNVRFAGRLEPAEVTRRMLGARMLVFPSIWYETFGLVIAEAMAAGLPVLASDLGGTAQVLDELASGWLAPPADAGGWASALRRLSADGVVDEGGHRARRVYEKLYTPARSLAALEDGYRRAMAS